MNRKETTKYLSELLEKYINPNNDPRIYYAKEVTFDYGTKNEHRIDYMQFKPKSFTVSGIEQGLFYAYEVKSSVEDFESGHGTNWYTADRSYIVTTEEVYEQIKNKLPHWVGFIAPDTYKPLKVIKVAKQHDRIKPCSEMLLCMFRSANRELIKQKKQKLKENKLCEIQTD